MGIDVNGLRFLLHAKRSGVDFSKTVMIGRQDIHVPRDKFCSIIRAEFGFDINIKMLEAIHGEKYCDGLLKYLGADVVHSFDYSDYEGATYVHDFNIPLADKHFTQYTALIEGGTLEHVFNFPTAIKNAMQMLKVGGHYLGMTPTNNYMGHGFYQFSPELYFRVLSPENGFRVDRMVFHEGDATTKWFSVPDPKDVKRRVEMRNAVPTLLLILATRVADCPIFASPPMQSDYVALYENDAKGGARASVKSNGLSVIKNLIPQSVRDRVKNTIGSHHFSPLFKLFEYNTPDSKNQKR